MTKKGWLWIWLGGGLLLILFVASLFLGSVALSPDEVWQGLTGNGSTTANAILQESRLPRALTALLASVALGLSGLLMQTLFRNPLAGPSVLGISSGASLGVGLFTLAAAGASVQLFLSSQIIGALLGAFAVLALILAVSHRLRAATTLLIFGLMMGYVTSALLGVLQYSASESALRSFVIWGLGSFANTTLQQVGVLAITTLMGVFAIFSLRRALNALTLGERYAATMGIHVRRSRLLMIVITGLLTGVATAFCGPVAFLGLATPHIARMIWKTEKMQTLVPATLLMAACIGLLCDIISRLPFFEGALPLNAVTCFVGVPVVISIIWSGKFWRKAA